MAAPIDGYNPNMVTFNVYTSGHGGVEIIKGLDTGTTDPWVAALEAGAYALADALAQAWPGDNVFIDCVYQGAKPVPMTYPAPQP